MDKVVVHAIAILIIITQEVPCAQNAIIHGFHITKFIFFLAKNAME